ncbi:MAG: hypothetical protein MJZ51_01855 [Bacteroidales bacterium]|nr:hypothetical protein [Bacteroidales bacterium]
MKAKKILLPILACIVLAITSGCSKEVTLSYEYDVYPNNWITQAGLNYYYATFANSDITPSVAANGMVVAYVLEDGRWNQLPYVFPYYSAAENATWGENIRFDWRTGEVTFIIQDLDGGLPEGMESIDPMRFKVCVVR